MDFLLVQEHHLCASRVRRCGSLLQGRSETFWFAAFGTGGAQGGVYISIAESWRSVVVDRGISVPSTAIWIAIHMRMFVWGF